jgi:hypothetical protein
MKHCDVQLTGHCTEYGYPRSTGGPSIVLSFFVTVHTGKYRKAFEFEILEYKHLFTCQRSPCLFIARPPLKFLAMVGISFMAQFWWPSLSSLSSLHYGDSLSLGCHLKLLLLKPTCHPFCTASHGSAGDLRLNPTDSQTRRPVTVAPAYAASSQSFIH